MFTSGKMYDARQRREEGEKETRKPDEYERQGRGERGCGDFFGRGKERRLFLSCRESQFKLKKIPSIIFGGSKYLRYLLEVNTFLWRSIGYFPHAGVLTAVNTRGIYFQNFLSNSSRDIPVTSCWKEIARERLHQRHRKKKREDEGKEDTKRMLRFHFMISCCL